MSVQHAVEMSVVGRLLTIDCCVWARSSAAKEGCTSVASYILSLAHLLGICQLFKLAQVVELKKDEDPVERADGRSQLQSQNYCSVVTTKSLAASKEDCSRAVICTC